MQARLLWVLLSPSLLLARPAGACQPPPCIGGELIPAGDFPVGLPAFLWIPEANTFDTLPAAALSARLLRDNGQVIPTHLEPSPTRGLLIVPDEPISPGFDYRMELSRHCTQNGTTTPQLFELRSTPGNGLPSRAGRLVPAPARIEPIYLADGSGSCSRQVRSVFIDVELSPDDPGWREVFVHQTFVDGVQYNPSSYPGPIPFGASWQGRGLDRVYTACEDPGTGVFNPGVGEGPHVVTMVLGVPGIAQTWTTDPLAIVLDCDGTVADGGVPPDGSITFDGSTTADAEARPDAVTPGGGPLLSAQPACGCSTTSAASAGPEVGIFWLLGAWSLRTKKARLGARRVGP